MYLVLDLETVPVASWTPPIENPNAFPPSWACRVVCAGVLILDRDLQYVNHYTLTDASERSLLWRLSIACTPHTVVTYNGRRFDLPVIVARALVLAVPIAWYYENRDARKRYSENGHLDLADVLTDFGAGRMMGLDDLASAMGAPGKVGGITGADVARVYAEEGGLERIAAYCMGDVVLTAKLLLRYKFIQGEIDWQTYTARQSALDTHTKAAT